VIENEADTFDVGGELTVRRLGFGAMRLTGENIIGSPDDEREAERVLHEAASAGVNLVDTADSYGPGTSERLVGEALAPYAGDMVIATKGGLLRNAEGEWLPCGDPDYLRNALLASLDRLRTETIDLYQLHRPDPDVSFTDSVHTLAEQKDAGRIEHVGLSNVSVEQLEAAREIVEIATVQNRYNLGDCAEGPVLEACADHGIGFIPWAPLGWGDLGEKERVAAAVAQEQDATVRQVALAWLLERADVVLPIPGTSSVAHLRENVAASRLELTDEQYARLSE
jgi:aryl-alcohol dehydrogenase-like predicted oxidoreductase